MMDAILEVPMTEVLEKVPLDQQTKTVLMGGTGLLRPVYQLMLAQESGQWDQAKEFAQQLHISESETGELWWEAMKWARQVSSRT
jgi:c-di-GMP-related signal transduction protein